MKKETLEEASLLSRPIHLIWDEDERYDCNEEFREEFEKGAKWQQERSYSEEDVVRIVQRLMYDVHCGGICEGDKIIEFKISPIKWFKKYKKK